MRVGALNLLAEVAASARDNAGEGVDVVAVLESRRGRVRHSFRVGVRFERGCYFRNRVRELVDGLSWNRFLFSWLEC